jgi:hypothetical protein
VKGPILAAIAAVSLLASAFTGSLPAASTSLNAASTSSPRSHFAGTDWGMVVFPVADGNNGCGINGTITEKVDYAQPDKDQDRALAFLVCNVTDAGQFSMLYSFAPGAVPGSPEYSQTLLSVGPYRWESTGFSIKGSTVSMAVAGYGPEGALCCPTIFRLLRWTWHDDRYVAQSSLRLTSRQESKLARSEYTPPATTTGQMTWGD